MANTEGRDVVGRLWELEAKATPRPWRERRASLDADHPDDPPVCWGIAAGKETWHRNMGAFHPDDAVYPTDEIAVVEIGMDRDYYTPEAAIPKQEDAALIAEVRNALPDLLAVVEAAKEYVKKLDDEGIADDDAIRAALARLYDGSSGDG